jgi:hypothetical protein
MDEMKHLNTEGLNDIEIPYGLEARLSRKIDQWAKSEGETRKQVSEHSLRKKRFSMFRSVSIAASIALLFGIGLMLHSQSDHAHKDTYDDPEQARQEAEKALNLLAYNLSKGMEQLEKVKEISADTNSTISKTLKTLENHE